MTSKFVEVQAEQFNILGKLLKTRLPKSGRLYNVINLVTRNGFNNSNLITKFYAYDGNITNLGTAFIVTLQGFNDFQAGYYALMTHPETLTTGMLEAFEKLIDWSKGGLFGELDTNFVPFFQQLAEKRRLLPGILSVKLDIYDCFGFQIEKEDALLLDVEKDCEKAGIILKQLDEQDIPTVNENWGKRELELVEYCVRRLPSAGIYVNGELVSWVITSPYGGINALHTKPAHRQKGYGVLVLKAIAKYQAQQLIDFTPISRCLKENVASKKVMEKAQCHYTHDLFWVFYSEKQN